MPSSIRLWKKIVIFDQYNINNIIAIWPVADYYPLHLENMCVYISSIYGVYNADFIWESGVYFMVEFLTFISAVLFPVQGHRNRSDRLD